MNTKIKIIFCFFATLLIIFVVAYLNNVFGISATNIEREARKSNIIGDSWGVSKSLNDELCALIFYDETLDDFSYSIYVNRDGLSFGYFFIKGGSTIEVEQGIEVFDYDIKGKVLISMNKDRVAKILLDDDIIITQIDVDPEKPFAVVIPVNCGSVTLYNSSGEIVPVNQ